jgi:hypothetical protein
MPSGKGGLVTLGQEAKKLQTIIKDKLPVTEDAGWELVCILQEREMCAVVQKMCRSCIKPGTCCVHFDRMLYMSYAKQAAYAKQALIGGLCLQSVDKAHQIMQPARTKCARAANTTCASAG